MATTTAPPVLTARTGAIGRVTLNRPEAMNAVTIELARGLERALRELAAEAHVIVIRGAGGNFCAGGDWGEVQRLRAEGARALGELFAAFRAACDSIAELPVPVIAAVEGNAMAGGFELMQACDIVLACEDARVADNHSNFGMVPGGGGSQRLPRLVGRQRALAHVLTGERASASELVAWGLAYRAFAADDFEAGVEAVAERLAAKKPAALARIKRLVHEGLRLPLAEGLDLEERTVVEHIMEGAE